MTLIADVVAGTVITVSWGNGIRDQVIATFSTEGTRNSSLSATEGRYADVADIDALTRGNGSTWDVIATKPLVASRATDASGIVSNTTLADVSGMSIAVAANKIYDLEADVIYTAAGGSGAGQLALAFSAPASATLTWSNIGLVVNGTSGVSGTATFDVSVLADTRSYGAAGTGTPVHVLIRGRLVVSSTAGDLRLRAAQVVSSGSATTIRAGTIMKLQMIP